MGSRRHPPRDFDVERRFAVEKVVVGQQPIGYGGETIRIHEIRCGDAQLTKPRAQAGEMPLCLEQTAPDDAPNLVDAVAEDESAVFDRDGGVRTRKKLPVQVSEHVMATQ
jgi:hypothetical protein